MEMANAAGRAVVAALIAFGLFYGLCLVALSLFSYSVEGKALEDMRPIWTAFGHYWFQRVAFHLIGWVAIYFTVRIFQPSCTAGYLGGLLTSCLYSGACIALFISYVGWGPYFEREYVVTEFSDAFVYGFLVSFLALREKLKTMLVNKRARSNAASPRISH